MDPKNKRSVDKHEAVEGWTCSRNDNFCGNEDQEPKYLKQRNFTKKGKTSWNYKNNLAHGMSKEEWDAAEHGASGETSPAKTPKERKKGNAYDRLRKHVGTQLDDADDYD
eukprot:GEMP01135025.1.p1 GENE.GEMP01135025.1~~GEMP01135025.1.p1  ORF type:complete len:121 (-),score=20.76 GEMP01135025.1:136-465(-)